MVKTRNKSESLVSEISEKLEFGVSGINSYIATAKSDAKSAKAKYEEITILQSELVEAKQTVSKCQNVLLKSRAKSRF